MQIEWIKAFVLLKEKMNFSDAAQEMFVSQSSFSKYIKALENSVGVTLVDRTHHRLRLTANGERMYPRACQVLREYKFMLDTVQEDSSESRCLHISISTAANSYAYLRHIFSFFEEHEEYELRLHEYEISAALHALEEGELDMLLCHSSLADNYSFDELRLREEELFYVGRPDGFNSVCPPEYAIPLNMKDGTAETPLSEIPLTHVVNDRLILHQNVYSEFLHFLSHTEISSSVMRPVATTASSDVLKVYLRGGNARSLLPGSNAPSMDPGHELLWMPVEGHPSMTLSILYQKDHLTKPGRDLLEHMREALL